MSLVILAVANIYYSVAEDLPTRGLPPQWHLFISRFLVGFGSGNVATCRAFVSEATTLENRNFIMTITGAAQGVGFVLGPALGFGLSYVKHESFIKAGPFTIDGYTLAGSASGVLAVLNLILIALFFHDIPHKIKGPARVRAPPMTRFELGSMLLVMWIFFVIMTGFSIFETVTGPMTQYYFGWTDHLNGLLILAAGLLSVGTFVVLGLLNRKFKFDDRKLIVYGMVGMFLSNVSCIAFWHTAGLALSQLIVSSLCVAFAYPVASAICYALFSKVIAPVAQGDKMGYLTAGGSLARMLGPVWAVALFDLSPIPVPELLVNSTTFIQFNHTTISKNATHGGGPGVTVAGFPGAWMFIAMSFLNLITIVLMFRFWKRLVPHSDYSKDAVVTNYPSKGDIADSINW